MITNYKINQPFTSKFSVEEGRREKFQSLLKSWSRQNCQPCWNLFYAEARKVSGTKTIQSQHSASKFVPGRVGQIFFWFPSRKAVFHLLGISKQAGKRSFRSLLKDLARQGLNSFTKHKRPVSSKDLEVLYAANQRGLNAPESFANSAWFNTILYFRKRGRENQHGPAHTEAAPGPK